MKLLSFLRVIGGVSWKYKMTMLLINDAVYPILLGVACSYANYSSNCPCAGKRKTNPM